MLQQDLNFFQWATLRHIPANLIELPKVQYQELQGVVTGKDIKLWQKLPPDILAPKEKLNLAMSLLQEDLANSRDVRTFILDYLEDMQSRDLKGAFLLSKAIWYFHHSLGSPTPKQRKTLLYTRSLLNDIEDDQLTPYTKLWLGLVEAALNEMGNATIQLIQLSKEVEDPGNLYYAISNLYKHMGMNGPCVFYRRRYKRACL